MPTFEIDEDSVQEKAFNSTANIQILAGGFGWGKTALLCVKCIKIMMDYPGCYGAIARNTQKNLEDVTYKEFLKWCPKSMIEKYPSDRDRKLVFKNGSSVLFSYMKLSKRNDTATMNLLGGTFDFIFVDQLDDPEFTYELFLQMQTRLRGTAQYVGEDANRPRYCNWFMATTNPTQNWVYRNLVRPLQVWKESGTVLPELIVKEDEKKEGKIVPDIELFEGSSLENRHTDSKYKERLKNIYKGKMYDKYVLGKWDVGEDLVYPMFNYAVHVVEDWKMKEKIKEKRNKYNMAWKESLDYGIANPSCYMLAFIDEDGNVNVIDGFYERELDVREQVRRIKEIREKYGVSNDERIIADPALFRRTAVDTTVADTFLKYGVLMERGNNNVLGGISVVSDYLYVDNGRKNPYSEEWGSPRLFISNELKWFVDEIVDYKWKEGGDKPVDKNDHAMDAIKYMLTFDDDKLRMLQQQVRFEQEIRRWRPVSLT